MHYVLKYRQFIYQIQLKITIICIIWGFVIPEFKSRFGIGKSFEMSRLRKIDVSKCVHSGHVEISVNCCFEIA